MRPAGPGRPDEPEQADGQEGTDSQAVRFRWCQLVGLTLLGGLALLLLAAAGWAYGPAVAGVLYVAGIAAWPLSWRRQRRAGRPVWWLVVVWPVAPLTFVGITLWSLLELLGSF